MTGAATSKNEILRAHLRALLRAPEISASSPPPQPDPDFHVAAAPGAAIDDSQPIDVVITINEINDRHGTGPLVKRIFKGRPNIFSIRSRNDWGFQDFGDWNVALPQAGLSRPACFRNVLRVLGGRKVHRVTCIPFLADELNTSIAVKECFDASLCLWVMDDQNVTTDRIPDALMRECLEKASLRLATHPELRLAYERKYGLPFYILPAIVPADLVAVEPVPPVSPGGQRAALIGSFWDQAWFDRLCSILAQTGWKIDWFGNNQSPWLKYPPERLQSAGITAFGVIPEEQLAMVLREYPFAVVPAGALSQEENNKGVASLSLPGRILFAVATSHTPILLVGNEKTCGARFIRHFGIGDVVPYDTNNVNAAIARLSNPAVQAQMRRKAASIAPGFSDRGVAEWLAASIQLGRPADRRFEDVFAGYDAEIDLNLHVGKAQPAGGNAP